MEKTVLIVGSNQPESLESSYARAFQEMGWCTGFWNPFTALSHSIKGGSFGQLFSRFVYVEPWHRKANVDLLQLAMNLQPNLLLIIATHGVRAGTLAQLRIQLPQMLIYCIYPDSPHNLDVERIHCFPFFDRTTVSSPAWVTSFMKLGASPVHYLPFAADTILYRPLKQTEINGRYLHDIAFIGTWRLEREVVLEQLADLDLQIWGSKYWKTRTRANSPIPQLWGGCPVIGDEFIQVCGQSKISLNIMDPVSWPGPNMRAFELPACNAFSLAERSEQLLEIFTEGETIECFSLADEAREKIDYYLRHDDERRRIAQASFQFVVHNGHTYINRVQQLLEWVAQDV